MSNQWALPNYADGDFTTAKPCGLPVFQSPLPNTTASYVFKQPFMQYLANVSPLALNTAHPSSGLTPDYSSYFLIAESEKEDIGAGVVRWYRTYSAVPASYSDFDAYVYNFIGTSPIGALAPANIGRFRFTERVTSRVQSDFFLMGATVTDPITGASVTPATPDAIPQIFALGYCIQFSTGGTQYGGWHARQDYVADGYVAATVGPLYITTPSQSDYLGMVQDAAVNGWGASKSIQIFTGTNPVLVDVSSLNTAGHTTYKGQIIAENSTLTRWMNTGNIWVRRTRYVLAM